MLLVIKLGKNIQEVLRTDNFQYNFNVTTAICQLCEYLGAKLTLR